MQASIIFWSPRIRALLYAFFFLSAIVSKTGESPVFKSTPDTENVFQLSMGKDKPSYAFNRPHSGSRTNT